MQPVARQLQQLDYNNFNGMFSMESVLRSYLEDNWVDPDGGFIPRQTGRLIVGRNMTLTLTQSVDSL
jgi:hypothetical protein